ncbi:orotidine 5'-phosphate decarboxylase [Candidatus Micrarchaeota archaeon]|nr:orotidine 5'-phosphate decarboxylase [Candidatus Micrarchaeota archaeon]
MVKLQLALDFAKLDDAISVAKVTRSYVDWIEAGTPLIKSEGLRSVRQLKQLFPDKMIVADMKIMDTGAFEVELAGRAGADVVTVLGAADEETIKGAIKQGRKMGLKVAVDLINVPESKWKTIDSLRPDFISVHVGIDQQMKGKNPLDKLKKIKVKSRLIVAGGMNKDRIPAAVKKGVSVIVVGGAITKASYPGRAAKEIRLALESSTGK